MRYYTRYALSLQNIPNGNLDLDAVKERAEQEVREMYGNPFYDSCKWYDHEDHMKLVSAHHPDVIFTLLGEGEEAGDIWRKYFLNGKMQVAKAVIEIADFDENLLK